MKKVQKPSTRFGVEIVGTRVHAECNELAQILALLQDQEGVVRVFDRENQLLLLDGTAQDVRASLGGLNRDCGNDDGPNRAVPCRDTADADAGHPGESSGPKGPGDGTTGKTTGLNIAAAYYFGDLANVTRQVDSQGRETFLRGSSTGPRRILGAT